MKYRFKPAYKIEPATPTERWIWDRVGFILRAVRLEEDIGKAEASAHALTRVNFVSCVWDPEVPANVRSHLELLRWDVVGEDVWVIYHWVADQDAAWIRALEESANRRRPPLP